MGTTRSHRSVFVPCFFFFFFLFFFARPVRCQCYTFNHTLETSPEYQPCGEASTMCCATNRTQETSSYTRDYCLRNGICQNMMNEGPSYWRESCTAKDWNSKDCLNVCMDAKWNGESGHAPMVPCDNTPTSEYWCCGTSTDCCGTPDAIKIAQTLGKPTATSSTSTATSTTSTATSSPTSSQSSSQSSASSGMSTGAKAGVGIGVSAGVIAVGGLLVFLFRRRQTNKATRTSVDSTYQLAPAPQELETRTVHEMPASQNAQKHELPARETEKFELPA